jgi:hypothetical protein
MDSTRRWAVTLREDRSSIPTRLFGHPESGADRMNRLRRWWRRNLSDRDWCPATGYQETCVYAWPPAGVKIDWDNLYCVHKCGRRYVQTDHEEIR